MTHPGSSPGPPTSADFEFAGTPKWRADDGPLNDIRAVRVASVLRAARTVAPHAVTRSGHRDSGPSKEIDSEP